MTVIQKGKNPQHNSQCTTTFFTHKNPSNPAIQSSILYQGKKGCEWSRLVGQHKQTTKVDLILICFFNRQHKEHILFQGESWFSPLSPHSQAILKETSDNHNGIEIFSSLQLDMQNTKQEVCLEIINYKVYASYSIWYQLKMKQKQWSTDVTSVLNYNPKVFSNVVIVILLQMTDRDQLFELEY